LWPCTQDNYGNPIRNWTARVERTPHVQYFADTPLVAAMRAFVAGKFGDRVPGEEAKGASPSVEMT